MAKRTQQPAAEKTAGDGNSLTATQAPPAQIEEIDGLPEEGVLDGFFDDAGGLDARFTVFEVDEQRGKLIFCRSYYGSTLANGPEDIIQRDLGGGTYQLRKMGPRNRVERAKTISIRGPRREDPSPAAASPAALSDEDPLTRSINNMGLIADIVQKLTPTSAPPAGTNAPTFDQVLEGIIKLERARAMIRGEDDEEVTAPAAPATGEGDSDVAKFREIIALVRDDLMPFLRGTPEKTATGNALREMLADYWNGKISPEALTEIIVRLPEAPRSKLLQMLSRTPAEVAAGIAEIEPSENGRAWWKTPAGLEKIAVLQAALVAKLKSQGGG